MATKTTAKSTEEVKTLNVWQKLLLARIDFYKEGVKKSGINTHAEFKYFELEDIVPAATDIFMKYNCLFVVSFPDGKAVGNFINLDNTSEVITVEFNARSIAEPGKYRMNEVQGLGAEITYMRRYLYFILLDIVESDELDKTSGESAEEEEAKPKKPATPEQRQEIRQELTAPEANADELQIKALKAALKRLKEIDPSKESFIQQIVIKTDSFKKISKTACEQLVLSVGEMVENYNVEE